MDLPVDLWLLVFHHLDLSDIVSCSIVCWDWIHLISHICHTKPFPIHLCEEGQLLDLDLENRITNWPIYLWFSLPSLTHGGQPLLQSLNKKADSIRVISLANCRISDELVQSLSDALLAPHIRLEDLLLSQNQISDLGLISLSRLLMTLKYLVFLDLHDNSFTSAGVISLAESLKTNSYLQELDLSLNSVTDDGAKALGDALRINRGLETISLASCNISSLGTKYLAKPLRFNYHLRTLCLNSNHVQDGGAKSLGKALQRNRSLTSLHLNVCEILSLGACSLARGLQHNPSLTTLQLAGNQISCIDSIVQVVKSRVGFNLHIDENPLSPSSLQLLPDLVESGALHFLSISQTGLTDDVSLLINQALKNQTSLLGLRLDCVGASINTLTEYLAMSTTLQSLEFGLISGTSLTYVQISISRILHLNSSLQSLSLAGNEFCDHGAQLLAIGLRHNTVLEALDLSYCLITDRGAQLILESLNSSLHSLILEGNMLTDVSIELLATFINSNNSLQFLDLRNNRFSASGHNKLVRLCSKSHLCGKLRQILCDFPEAENRPRFLWDWVEPLVVLCSPHGILLYFVIFFNLMWFLFL